MSEITPELERKIEEIAISEGVNPESVKKQLDFLKKNKKKILGVWGLHGWLWIATEQPTKPTWFGVVFSPFVENGEYGSWYVGEPEENGAKAFIEPEYRFKGSQEASAKSRKYLKDMGL